ncbi:MAG: DUF6653 family protein [Planctomycetota bacterium]
MGRRAVMSERLMGMDDRVWLRHANPWSVYTRLVTAPLSFLALWSWVWVGWWALVFVGVAGVWVWLNPRVFSRVRDDRSWATRGVFGEMIWLRRRDTPIPTHHADVARATQIASFVFMVPAVYGLIVQDFWAACLGWHGSVLAKVWFVDRMVWLYTDCAHEHAMFEEFLTTPAAPR